MRLASVARSARFVVSMLLLALASAIPAAHVAAQGVTFSGRQIKTGGQYQLAADFNGDGRADIATAGLDVEILLGLGDGTFQPNVKYPIGTSLSGITVGDFNNDARLDIAVSITATVEVAVLLGLGDGTFSEANRFPTGATGSPSSVVAADFNGDGRLDLLTADPIYCRTAPCFLTKTATILLGNGDGTFQTISRHMVPNNGRIQLATIDPAVADFNGDGKPDVAAHFYNNVGGTTIGTIILTNTSGTSPRSPALAALSVQPASVLGGTVAEVNIPLAAGAVAPSGGLTFTASNTNPSVAFLPFSQTSPPMLMAAGMTNLRFKVETKPVTTTQTITVTVRHSSLGSRSVNLTVTPPSEPLALDSLKVSTGTYAGNDAAGEVYLKTGHVAPPGGIVVTLTNDNPHLITSMPSSVTIPGGQSTGWFPVQTWTTGTTTPVNFTASYNGVTKTAVMNVHAPTQNVPISSVTLSQPSVVGGSNQAVQAVITLAANAPSEGATIMLTSTRPDIVLLPRSTRIFFSTQNTAYVNFIANPVSAPTEVTVTAHFGDSTGSAVLTVLPPPAGPALSSLTLNPASVAGGGSSQGTVTISAASSSPTTVSLASSSSPSVTVPSSVTIPAGATSASFTVNTTSVSSSASTTITASLNGLSRSAVLTITPAADTVAIQRAEYESSKRTLRVEATSTRTNATMQVLVTSTGQIVGTLANNGGGRYSATLNWSVNPQNITVRSSFGGSASRSVVLK